MKYATQYDAKRRPSGDGFGWEIEAPQEGKIKQMTLREWLREQYPGLNDKWLGRKVKALVAFKRAIARRDSRKMRKWARVNTSIDCKHLNDKVLV